MGRRSHRQRPRPPHIYRSGPGPRPHPRRARDRRRLTTHQPCSRRPSCLTRGTARAAAQPLRITHHHKDSRHHGNPDPPHRRPRPQPRAPPRRSTDQPRRRRHRHRKRHPQLHRNPMSWCSCRRPAAPCTPASAPTKSPRCANAAPFSHRRQAGPVTRCCAGPAGRGVFTVASGPPAGDPNPQPLTMTSRQRVPSVAGEAPPASTHARAGTAAEDISGPTNARRDAARRLAGAGNPPQTRTDSSRLTPPPHRPATGHADRRTHHQPIGASP